ncbi:MAG: metal ABC transporter substrate-binding protein [Acidobacteriota bacterium]
MLKWQGIRMTPVAKEGASMHDAHGKSRIRAGGRFLPSLAALVLTLESSSPDVIAAVRGELDIVASLTVYADIARQIAGERARVQSIADSRQDAHFVQAKPSYSIMVSRAELLVGTGLDLELWMPAVIDKSRNPRIREGEPGYVAVAADVPMLQVPENPSRAAGDIHIFGNPHLHTDPLRAVIVADNIKIGLQKVDSSNRDYYEARFQDFKRRIHERLFGRELVELMGGDKLAELEMKHQLRTFLENNQLGGRPLLSRLGGWMKEAECLRGKRIVAYHLNWIYFMDRFGIGIASYVERRPGIPPSASHVADLISLMRRENMQVLWVANYFDEQIPSLLAERTGAKFLYVPLYTGGSERATDYFSLVDTWIRTMRSAYPDCQGE